MRTRVRMWTTLKRCSAVATFILLSSWLSSGWVYVAVSDGGGRGLGINGGAAFAQTAPFFLLDETIEFGRYQGGAWKMNWWYVFQHPPKGWVIFVPLWMPTALALGVTMLAWRQEARARRQIGLKVCVRCGYDLAGLAEGAACPECGSKA